MTPFRQALVAISALAAAACSGPPGGSFYGTWIPGTPDTVWNVIALHDVRGCADVAYQQHSRDKALYAVSCTSTANEWRYYLVDVDRRIIVQATLDQIYSQR